MRFHAKLRSVLATSPVAVLLCALVIVIAARSAGAQVNFTGARNCNSLGLNWSSDLGSDYGASFSLDGCTDANNTVVFTSGATFASFTERDFGSGKYISAADRVFIEPAGLITAARPVVTYFMSEFVTTNGQSSGCQGGWIYGLFSDSSNHTTIRFDPVPTVYWAVRVSSRNAVKTGCLGGTAVTLNLGAGYFTLTVGSSCDYFGSAQNVSQLDFIASSEAHVGAGNGSQGDTAQNDVQVQYFVDTHPITLPPRDAAGQPCPFNSADCNANGITDSQERFTYQYGEFSNLNGAFGHARNSRGGNSTSGDPNRHSHGYQVVDDIVFDIPAPDAGKLVTEIIFHAAESTAGNSYGLFEWNGAINTVLFRDTGAIMPVGENGDDCSPLINLDLVNGVNGVTITRTPLNVFNFNAVPGLGQPSLGGPFQRYEYRITKPTGLFLVPRIATNPARWWLGVRPCTDSTTSGVALIEEYVRSDVGAKRHRPDPNPGSGVTPDCSGWTELPFEACSLDVNGGGCPRNRTQLSLFLFVRTGNDNNGDGIPDECGGPPDCNGNGRSDYEDIARGVSPDSNGNGIPDQCECRADFNADGFVNPDDLADFITCFFLDIQFPGICPAADFNRDGFRDPDDLADFITTFFLGC